MRRFVQGGLFLLVLSSVCLAQTAEDAVMRAMRDELARSAKELQIGDLEKPYFIAYRVQERTGRRLEAHFGTLVANDEVRGRFLTVELRVGDYALDNTNFLTMPSGPAGVSRSFRGTAPLPLEDDYKELRRKIWLTTDGVYKKAAEDYSRKRAVLENMARTEEIPDFTKEEPATTADDAPPITVDLARAEALVRGLSGSFEQAADIHASAVRLHWSNEKTHYVNSEGSSFTRVKPLIAFTAAAATQAPDGQTLEDFVTVYGRYWSDLLKENHRQQLVPLKLSQS